MRGIKIIQKSDLTLLGAPIYVNAVEKVIDEKIENLKVMVGRLKQIESHEALFLFRNCFVMPKLTYFLKTAPNS